MQTGRPSGREGVFQHFDPALTIDQRHIKAHIGQQPLGFARQKFFRRVWVTRRPLWADRLASAWLIRRFIDAEGKVFWGDRDQNPPETAVTFGYDGAVFCNTATQVTYEVLLESFGLAKDPALTRIATIIHALDIGGQTVPEAAGVETLLQGAQRRATGEEELFAETEKTFDLLYDAYFETPPS